MVEERLCGNCMLGAPAVYPNGEEDPNYVICQVKEMQNRGRKPDRYQTISAVSRMHVRREACLHWQEHHLEPLPPPPPPIADAEFDDWGTPLQMEMPSFLQPPPVPPPPMPAAPNPHEEEVKKLRNQLLLQDQLVQSLQNQNRFLTDQIDDLRQKNQALDQQVQALKLLDISDTDNYFALLGVDIDGGADAIKEAYRSKMKFYHPDHFVHIARQLNVAYETLMDPEKRRLHLQSLKTNPHFRRQ